MKKIKLCFILAIAVVAFASCNKQKKEDFQSPEKVTTAFVQAFYTGDFNNMYKFTLSKNHVIIDNLKNNLPKAKLEEVQKNKVEVQKVVCTMQKDSVAECKCHFIYNGADREIPFDLRKEDGKWLVDLSLN